MPRYREFLGHPGPVAEFDRSLRPYRWIEIPDRAVIGCDSGNAAKHVERRAAVGQRAVQALTLRIVLAGWTVGEHENTLDRAKQAVVGAAIDILQPRGVGRALQRCGQLVVRVGREVKHWLGETKSGGEHHRDRLVARTNPHDLLMNETMVRISVTELVEGVC